MEKEKKTQAKKVAADILSERGTWVRIGLLVVRVRPITLSQIYDMGAIISDVNAEGLDLKNRINVINEMIEHYADADKMRRAALVIMFRAPFKRWLFRRYIFRRLRIATFQKLILYTAKSFDANFFLTSIIFLRKIADMTEPSQTTAHGLSSEE